MNKTAQRIIDAVHNNGGWVNSHAHFDRAFSFQLEDWHLSSSDIRVKWDYVDALKRRSSVGDIRGRMEQAVELMLEQGCRQACSFIDIDEVIGDKALTAAKQVIAAYGSDFKLSIANQVLKGVLDKDAQSWFDFAAQEVDILGALPARDAGNEGEHLDYVLQKARELGKPVHAHVDQFNDNRETETELLARKTIEHDMQSMVCAVHAVSLAAHPKAYRHSVYELLREADIGVICCPVAWIDHGRKEQLQPSHNSMTPVDELLDFGVKVAIGSDNIEDIYKPLSDGDLWRELWLMMEALEIFDQEALVRIATSNGRELLAQGVADSNVAQFTVNHQLRKVMAN